MYVVYNIDYIHHLFNESKKLTFAYNSDQMVYMCMLYFIVRYSIFLTQFGCFSFIICICF